MEEFTRKAAATAHRNLQQRIERQLGVVEREGRAPSDRESLWIQRAIDALRVGEYRRGEEDMLYAERWEAFKPTFDFGDARVLGLVPLRELLQAVAAQE